MTTPGGTEQARSGGPARAAGPRLLAPLRYRDFRILWLGMSCSLLGDGVLLVALAWQVYSLTGSPGGMAAVSVALAVPQVLLLLLGGVVSDRADRRLIMLVSELVRGACLVVMAALAFAGAVRLGHLIVLAAVYGSASGFFPPAYESTLPNLVPARELVATNALDQLVRPAAVQLGGTLLGGVLVAAGGAGTAFAFDAFTFAVSAGCLLALHPLPPRQETGPAGRERPSRWADLRVGADFVRRNAWLWATLVASALAYLLFLGPTEVLLPYVVKQLLHGSATDYALVLASGGVSAVLAAVLVGRRGLPRRFVTFMYCTWTLATLAVAGYGLATRIWQLAVASAMVNGLETGGLVAWATMKQRLVPGALLGRVSSVDWFVTISLIPVSYALTAPVAAAIGPRTTLIGAGVIGAAATLVFLYVPGVRDAERVPAGGPKARAAG
ncbi:MFS transporter [Kitasatospora sp. NPDC058965]|uniref:MFS transporter n=1 Tax=Kitasatospora sp. NPDC058965 TaxID=3346682 RepID=UPI0036ADB4C1